MRLRAELAASLLEVQEVEKAPAKSQKRVEELTSTV